MGGWRWTIECRGWDDQQLAKGRVLTTAQDVLVYFGAPRVKVVADMSEVATWEQNAQIKFPVALQLALEAYTIDHDDEQHRGRTSPLDLILRSPQAFGLENATPIAAASLLRAYLAGDQAAEVVLLTPTTMRRKKYHTPPGFGESLTDNWVFRICLPNTFNRLIFAVVDRFGKQPPYCYVPA